VIGSFAEKKEEKRGIRISWGSNMQGKWGGSFEANEG